MKPVVKRIITALSTAGFVVAGLLGLHYALGAKAFTVILPILIILVTLVQAEFYQMISRKYSTMLYPGLVWGVVYLVGRFVLNCPSLLILAIFALALTALFGKYERPIEAFATTLLGFLYIPFMLSSFIDVPRLYGIPALLYIIAIIKLSDMGGFAVGMAFGRHKMCPSVSPNKSWEGMAGSILGSCLMSAAFMPLTGFSIAKSLAFGVTAAVVGTLGDLVESRMKRDCGVKDSAVFMPAGLGGLLDMFDSLIFAPALLIGFFR